MTINRTSGDTIQSVKTSIDIRFPCSALAVLISKSDLITAILVNQRLRLLNLIVTIKGNYL